VFDIKSNFSVKNIAAIGTGNECFGVVAGALFFHCWSQSRSRIKIFPFLIFALYSTSKGMDSEPGSGSDQEPHPLFLSGAASWFFPGAEAAALLEKRRTLGCVLNFVKQE
jgi:hypothetical protein